MNTKYLKRFNHLLVRFRDEQRLSQEDVAKLCLVDASVVKAWEHSDHTKRCYPTLDNLLDLCFKTSTPLESFVEIPGDASAQQLDLPGLTEIDEADLADTLTQLDKELDKLIPAKDEMELLRRFRKSDKQNQELILQLIRP